MSIIQIKNHEIDKKDKLIQIDDIRLESAARGDVPLLFSDDSFNLFLAYYLSPRAAEIVKKTTKDVIAFVTFTRCYIHIFGAPNDEALGGHFLAAKGLKPWSIFEVQNSSWIQEFEKKNLIHPYRDKKRFMKNKRHFIFCFKDCTFECIAENYKVENECGSPFSIIQQKMTKNKT